MKSSFPLYQFLNDRWIFHELQNYYQPLSVIPELIMGSTAVTSELTDLLCLFWFSFCFEMLFCSVGSLLISYHYSIQPLTVRENWNCLCCSMHISISTPFWWALSLLGLCSHLQGCVQAAVAVPRTGSRCVLWHGYLHAWN